MLTLHWVDYVILGIIALSILTGLFRGFVKELISLTVWILAIWAAIKFSNTLDPWLTNYIHDSTIRMVVGFVAVLVGVLVVGGLVNALLSFILQRSGLSGTDRLLGMGFGFVRGVFIVSLLILIVRMSSLPHEEYSKDSRLYSKFDPVVNWLYSLTPEFIKHAKMFDKTEETPRNLQA